MKKLENLTKLILLYDYYGEFLTQKQREFFELHYLHDLSLGEIAENYGITRQGVYDNVRRAQTILEDHEEKLGIVKKHFTLKEKVEQILVSIEKLQQKLPDDYGETLQNIYENIASLLKESGE